LQTNKGIHKNVTITHALESVQVERQTNMETNDNTCRFRLLNKSTRPWAMARLKSLTLNVWGLLETSNLLHF
jgi:hypothetical protein